MKKAFGILAVAVAALVLPACTNKQGETEAPVFITVTLPLQPLSKSISSGTPLQIQTITLTSHLKNSTATDPQHFADAQMGLYRVTFGRLDGGTRVPPPENFSAAIVLPSGGAATLNGFPIISASTLQLSPFDQLLPFNGGVDRETGRTEIHISYSLTFFGTTASGQRVQSESATGDVFILP